MREPTNQLRNALVLVENEKTVGGAYDFWEDITGIQYHYPNQYKNRVRPGRPFVYYRGVRRTGGQRGQAEYFGAGTVGEVWVDPKRVDSSPRPHWYCAIEGYVGFSPPVPAKTADRHYETQTSGMAWRTCVREISIETFHEILAAAGLDLGYSTSPQVLTAFVDAPSVSLAESASELLIPRSRILTKWSGLVDRDSTYARAVGDRAEELVFDWLRKTLPEPIRETLDWVAKRGVTPGWDVEYLDGSGLHIAIEVKGTTLSRFAAVELSANEWRAACAERERYALALVASVFTATPRLALLWDPVSLTESGEMAAMPTGWRLIDVGRNRLT
jgi:Domain of unknown function (DUF3883)